MTDPTNPNLSAPSGSDLGEGELRAAFRTILEWHDSDSAYAKGGRPARMDKALRTLRKARSTPSSILTPDADLSEALGGYDCLESLVGNLEHYSRLSTSLGETVREEFGTAAKVIRALSATPTIRARAFEEADEECVLRAITDPGSIIGDRGQLSLTRWQARAAIRALKGTSTGDKL